MSYIAQDEFDLDKNTRGSMRNVSTFSYITKSNETHLC